MEREQLTHITGTFVIDAMPSFLNGAGVAKWREDKTLTMPKTFADGTVESSMAEQSEDEAGVEEGGPTRVRKGRTPFISSQSFRRMLRDTAIEESGEQPSLMRAYKQDDDGHTSKAGTALDPVAYLEDDVFGYMYTSEGSGKPRVTASVSTEDVELSVGEIKSNNRSKTDADQDQDQDQDQEETNAQGEDAAPVVMAATSGTGRARVKTVSRFSPLSTSILVGLRKDGWRGVDDAFVHLTEGTPLPYSTEFTNTPFTGIFSLNYSRLCRFKNIGDRIELADGLVEKYLASNTIKPAGKEEYYSLENKEGNVLITKGRNKGQFRKGKVPTSVKKDGIVYELTDNAAEIRKARASAIINSLAVLRGGAKQAAFETDVSPKVLIMAGLTCGNPIFNTLFQDYNTGNTRGKTVSIDIKALKEIVADYRDRICTPVYVGIRTGFLKNEDQIRQELTREENFIVTTPIDAARQLTKSLPPSTSTSASAPAPAYTGTA
ncbi:MAG TPA: hypothetical protein VH796_09250 [Nitrososphaeraceae archaeon]